MIQDRVRDGAIPAPVISLCRKMRELGHRAWIVGGSLRDVLMEREASDWDLATTATPQQMMAGFKRVIPTGIDHGTVTILWQGEPYEVTTLRGEGAYTDGRRPDAIHFVNDIDEDLARRDFTVNAVAYDPIDDRVIDPHGGLDDMRRRLLRTVGDPVERFGEDGLRILRAARFVATLEFELDDATEAAVASALDVYRKVSHERVRDEWIKAMKAREPSRAFQVMLRTGILDVTCPDLVEQAGCTQNKHHAFDVWHHSLSCLDACPADPIHRMAGLLHDLGKPRTRELSDKTGDYTFYNHEHVGARMAALWLKQYRFSNDEQQRVTHLVRNHLVCYSREWSDAAVRRFIKRVGLDNLDDLMALAAADAHAKGRPVEQELADLDELRQRVEGALQQGVAFGLKDLAVGGRDLMSELHLKPGRHLGDILKQLLDQVIEDPTLNERQKLLAAARVLSQDVSDER